MSTFVYMTRCDGCGHCVDICPSDIMHIDETIRRAKNIEPNFCWECYSCVKACPNHAIDVRGYADFAPMGHSVRVRREEEKGTISWKIKFRNGTTKDFISPITTKPWGKFIPKLADADKPNQGEINSQILYSEPKGLNTNKELPKVDKSVFKKGPNRFISDFLSFYRKVISLMHCRYILLCKIKRVKYSFRKGKI